MAEGGGEGEIESEMEEELKEDASEEGRALVREFGSRMSTCVSATLQMSASNF